MSEDRTLSLSDRTLAFLKKHDIPIERARTTRQHASHAHNQEETPKFAKPRFAIIPEHLRQSKPRVASRALRPVGTILQMRKCRKGELSD
jgi:hypothetical protein